MRPRQALRQVQRPCHTSLRQKLAVKLDCVFRSSFVRFLAFPFPLTQFFQCLLCAFYSSIVVLRMKLFGILRYDGGICCVLQATRQLVIRAVPTSRHIPLVTLTGWLRLQSRLSTIDYAPRVSLSCGLSLGRLSLGLLPLEIARRQNRSN